MKLESKHFFQCILVDRPIVGISTKWYSHIFFNFILEGFFEMGNQKFFYSKFISFIMYYQIR